MRHCTMLAFCMLIGCAAPQPPRLAPIARFDQVRGDECVRADMHRRLVDLGENVSSLIGLEQERPSIEEAMTSCGVPPADRYLTGMRAWGAVREMRSELDKPYRERRNAAASRENAERAARRDTELHAAGRRYLMCAQAAAASLAVSSTEAATVIADAAAGSCPNEAAELSRVDWQMKPALDTAARASLLALILRARERQMPPQQPIESQQQQRT